jgi:endoglucanase
MKRIVCICFSLLFFAACDSNTAPAPACNPDEENCGGHNPGCNPDEEECGEPGPQPPDPPQPPAGDKLYVEGRQLKKSGSPIVLRGMSLYWYTGPWAGNQPGNKFYIESTVQALASSEWGANVVRAAIGNVAENTSDALGIAKNMMDWAKTHNIYVIIDNHSHYAHRPGPSTATNNFFRDVSAYVQQKGYTHVIYEIYNEPLCDNDQTNNISCTALERTTWDQIKPFSIGVINTIRANDREGVILVGTPNYSANINNAMNDPITGQNNIMYVFHYYGSETGHNNNKSRIKSAYCANFPVFVTEWGTSPASGNGTINTANNNDWMSLIERAGLSWANWSLVNGRESSAALTTTEVNGPTTQSGEIVKQWIKDLNAGRSTSGVNPGAVDMGCP